MRYLLAHGYDGRGRRSQRLRRRRAAAPAGRPPRPRRRTGDGARQRGGAARRRPPAAGQPGRPGARRRRHAEALAAADLVVLALPHGASGRLAAQLPAGLPVVDLGADHRLADAAAWASAYGGPHAGTWTYGLPELPGQRDAIAASHRVAVTGCYAVAITLALAPLVAAGLVEPDDVVVVAASGTSGAGRGGQRPPARQRGDGRPLALQGGPPPARARRSCRRPARRSLSFTPVLAPMPRGILATVTARPARAGDRRGRRARGAARAAYGGEPFVHVLPDGRWPHTAATAGQQQRPPAGDRRRQLRPGRRLQRDRQPGQGRRRPGGAVRQPHARPARDRRPDRRTGWRRERRRRRARASGRPGSPPASQSGGRPRPRPRRQRRPARRGGRRVHRQPGQGRAGAVDAAGAGHRAAHRRRAQLRRRQRLHRRRRASPTRTPPPRPSRPRSASARSTSRSARPA